MAEDQLKAKRERKGELVGVGCFIQGLGLIAPFLLGAVFGIVGAVVGGVLLIFLLLIGSRKALKWQCGNCKNPIASKDVKMCPVCKAHLE